MIHSYFDSQHEDQKLDQPEKMAENLKQPS